MFGYIIPDKPELKIREYELFKGYYCAVCKCIGQRHGLISRMSLSYDATFLALLLSSLSDVPITVKAERCLVHPLRKRNVVYVDNATIEYAADMNVVLAYYNLIDDFSDEKSLVSRSSALLLKKAVAEIRVEHPEKCDIIEKNLAALARLEKEKCPSMDKAAEPFAKLMEEVILFPALKTDEKNTDILKWIGYNLGKWLYIIDAYDDLEEDFKKNTYNPFICEYNGYKENNICQFKNYFRERVNFNLTYTLSEIAKAYELLDIKKNRGIIENIVYLGMLKKTEQIIGTGSCNKVEKSV